LLLLQVRRPQVPRLVPGQACWRAFRLPRLLKARLLWPTVRLRKSLGVLGPVPLSKVLALVRL
jgi:hypothetical protein